ncbi:MAG: hypothetical protein ABWY78_21590 [Microvirga sp.]
MAVDRDLLREALRELVRLRTKAFGERGIVSRLYKVALEEWARRLGVEARKLNRLVLVREAFPARGHPS